MFPWSLSATSGPEPTLRLPTPEPEEPQEENNNNSVEEHSFAYFLTPTNRAIAEAVHWSTYTLSNFAGGMQTYFAGGMETGIPQDESQQPSKAKEIYYVSFNQDSSGLAVGHEDGYTLYSLTNSIDRLEKIHEGQIPERACVVERLYMSSLLTIVSMKSTRKLQVYHSGKQNEICCHTYPSAILRVKMNRWRVVVCLEDSIHIHNVRDMRLLHTIKDTPLNAQGIMDLSNDQKSYLAFPSNSSTGHVMVFDTEALVTTCSFGAHSGPIAALRFNPDGTKLATASDKGTVIRVFGVPSGERLFEFTRGMKRCVTVSSLAFSQDSRLLALSSNTETIHVFSLARSDQHLSAETHHRQAALEPEQHMHSAAGGGAAASAQEGIGAWVNYFSQQAQQYLPQQMNDLMMREKSVTTARLPIQGTHCVVAIPRIQQQDYLLVASTEGYLFCYTLDSAPSQGAGGSAVANECTLMRQYRIGPEPVGVDAGLGLLDTIPIPIKSGASKKARGDSIGGSPSSPPQSASLLGQSPPSSGSGGAAASSGARRQPPPPIPPAPKSTKAASPAISGSTNPFEVDDKGSSRVGNTGAKEGSSEKEKQEGGEEGLLPPADLNDMDEFPPLHHATL